uniref:Mediator of RNA polymerase II transcription subunit 7 n=1 Tax=Panagrolaimus sp. JU765 TaxID=591449 RepID=A0AC34QD63_9BILA
MAFPNPPSYAKLYTKANFNAGLCPPPPPVPSKFTVFGEEYNLEEPMVPSLPSLGLPQFFGDIKTSGNIKDELKKLNGSLLAAFLDLTQLLIVGNPLSPHVSKKFEDLAFLFFNFHHLLNEFRVVQARATLVQIQREQNQKLRRVLTKMAKAVVETKQILSESMRKTKEQLENVPALSTKIETAPDFTDTECYNIWQVTRKSTC